MDTQIPACHSTFVKKISSWHHLPSKSCILPLKFDPLSQAYLRLRAKTASNLQFLPISNSCLLPLNFDPPSQASLRLRAKTPSSLQCTSIPKSRQPLQICLAGGRGMIESNNEDFPWKAKEKLKGRSIEDILRQQIDHTKYDHGSSGVKPPRGGDGGGGGGSGGSGDGSFAGKSNETLQVVLATIGFLFLYIYILTGEELMKLVRDYIKYLFTGRQSVRLKRVIFKWERLCRSLTEKVEVVDTPWMEKAILRRNYLQSKSTQ